MGTGNFKPEKFFSGLKVPVPIVASITTCIEIETLEHLFWECIHVQLFLTNLSTLLQDYNVFIHFNLRNIMLGITEGTNQTEVQTKNFINLLHFKLYLKHRINIEKHIYFKKDRLAQFNKNGETLEH